MYIDITNVAELTNYTFDNQTLELGANITLTTTNSILNNISASPGFGYLGRIRDHIDLVAHVPVRNVSEDNIK